MSDSEKLSATCGTAKRRGSAALSQPAIPDSNLRKLEILELKIDPNKKVFSTCLNFESVNAKSTFQKVNWVKKRRQLSDVRDLSANDDFPWRKLDHRQHIFSTASPLLLPPTSHFNIPIWAIGFRLMQSPLAKNLWPEVEKCLLVCFLSKWRRELMNSWITKESLWVVRGWERSEGSKESKGCNES